MIFVVVVAAVVVEVVVVEVVVEVVEVVEEEVVLVEVVVSLLLAPHTHTDMDEIPTFYSTMPCLFLFGLLLLFCSCGFVVVGCCLWFWGCFLNYYFLI